MGPGSKAQTGGGGQAQQGEECPRKFETYLIDVLSTGNADYAAKLKSGDKLDIATDAFESGIVLKHDNINIGYLAPQKSIIIQCIKNGWKYSATIISVIDNNGVPQIKVLIIGAP
jgi:hypothetical protein